MSIKVAKKDFASKMKDFDEFTKKCLKCVGTLGKIIIATGFEKLHKVQ